MTGRAPWQRAVFAASFLAILACYALPFVRLTALARVETFTGIDLVTFRAPSPATIPPDEFERRQGEGYETILPEGQVTREVIRADDAELAREIRGERAVAVLVLALALAGLVATFVRRRVVLPVAAAGTAIMLVGLLEAANPTAILESPPSAEHFAGWWIPLGIFGTVLLAELAVRVRARGRRPSRARAAHA
jgi:hypothetical protein